LDEVAQVALGENAPVHMPRIGTGAAGGDWRIIEQLVLDTLVDRGVELTVVDLPPQRKQQDLFG
jgi:hypothetical protein